MFKKFLCVFIAFILLITCFSACSKDEEGATFNVAVSELPQHFDPQIAESSAERQIAVNIFDGLFKLDENGVPQKCAVKDYKVSDDGLTYTFTLYDNMKYFVPAVAQSYVDEKEKTLDFAVTAQDFAFGITRGILPETNAPDYELLSVIKNAEQVHNGKANKSTLGIKVIDKLTLEITLEKKSASFLYALSQPVSYPCDEEFFNLTGGRYGLERKYLISNGGFYLSAINEGKSVRIWNNAEYTGVCKAQPQSVGFYLDTDSLEIAKAVNKGDYTLGFFADGEAIEKLNRKVNMQNLENIGVSLVFNMKNDTLQNNTLRQGLISCIDLSSVSENQQNAVVPSYYKINGTAIDNSKLEAISYNIENARSKMIKAFEELDISTLTVDILCTAEYENYAKSIISCWQKNIGVELNGTVTVVEKNVFLQKLNSGEYDTAICPLTLDTDKAEQFLSQFMSTSDSNFSGYNSAEYDRILKDLTANPTNEKAVYAQSYLLKNAVILPLATENTVFALAKDITGVYFAGDSSNVYFYKGQEQ